MKTLCRPHPAAPKSIVPALARRNAVRFSLNVASLSERGPGFDSESQPMQLPA